MSSYGGEISCNKLQVNRSGVLTSLGWEKSDFGEYQVAADVSTFTLNQTSSYFIIDVFADSTPAAQRVITITFTPPTIPESFNPNMFIQSIAPATTVASTNLYVAQFQKLNNTSWKLIVEHNGGSATVAETVRVIGKCVFNI
jgi:hypothetical protein